MKTLTQTLNKFLLLLFVVSVSLMAACSDDPQSTNEEEVITTITVTLTPEEGDVVTLSWDDTNLDAIVDESEITVSNNLVNDETYQATIELWNKSTNPDINITEEVAEEAEDHIFCFTVTGVEVAVTNRDEDSNGLPLGITSTWTTSDASTGTINISLRHQPGVKTGDCPGVGDTDVNITFDVTVEIPSE